MEWVPANRPGRFFAFDRQRRRPWKLAIAE